ncbi:putative ankyrin repeat protein RF_0381 [Artemia franciscana]|uniref:putative ankyrin repeat protein RF_0381 n=1 Tax=Artemia franciscana TaxID=6661 RepID=UPI0032DB2547
MSIPFEGSLYLAASKGCTQAVEYFLKSGIDVNKRNFHGETPLYLAASEGHTETVECLIQSGADLNIKCLGNSPLHVAALNRNTQTVECLLKSGTDVNIRNSYGKTPLYLAALEGHTETVECLIQSGADLNIKCGLLGNSPLHVAALNGNTQTVECLLKSGTDVNIRNSNGKTPLYFAAIEGYTEIVECLIQSDADLNIKSSSLGDSPLHVAAWKGNIQMVECLLKSGTDVNIRNNNGETPLCLAALEGHTETVECLIQSGADLNIKSSTEGDSPLHVAAWNGNTQTVECLLKSGTDVNIRNNYGETPLFLAFLEGPKENVEYLIASGADLNINCREDKTQTVECLLKYGAYVNSKEKDGMTALHYASRNGDKECVATLLEHGSDIDITNINDHTAFDVAVDDTAVYFASHVLKLRVANLYVSERNIRLSDKTQTSYPANELKDQLVRELEQMRSETIFCNITFYDIFIKGISSIELYTMNENSLKGLLKSSNWETKFSMYNTIIKSRFRNSIERKVLLELANRSFNSLFNRFAELPHECAEQILSYLSNENLKIFINDSELLHKEW